MSLPKRCPCGCRRDLRYYTHFPGGMKFLRCGTCAKRMKMDEVPRSELLDWQLTMIGDHAEEGAAEHAAHGKRP